jgi:hypothetical protein
MSKMRTRTEYSFERLMELQKVVSKVLTPQQTSRKRIFNLVLGTLGLGAGAYFSVAGGNPYLSSACILMGLILLIRCYFFFHLMAWNANRVMKKAARVHEFQFEADHILAWQGQNSAEYPYARCKDLLETAHSFYFIMEDGQGLMMDKAGLQGGSADELRSLLEQKSGKTAAFVNIK